MLKECLETLRFTHRLVIGVIAATFIFAISPNPKQIAYEHLNYLETLNKAASDHDKFRNVVRDYASQYNNKSVCIDAAKKYLSAKGITVTETSSSLMTSYRSGAFRNNVTNYAFDTDETLNNIRARMLLPIFVYAADEESLSKSIAESRLSVIEQGSQIKLNASILASAGHYKFPPGHKNRSINPDWECLYSVFEQGNSFSSKVVFNLIEKDIPIKSWGQWLHSNKNTHSLVAKNGESLIPFPNLQDVWYELGPLTFTEAINRLKENLKSRQNALQVLGFSIEPTSALLLSPIFLFVSLLYFCTHASHCLRIAKNDVETLSSFPWMGLYSDRIGVTTTYLTLMILPAFSLVLLLLNTQTENKLVFVSTYILASLILLLGINSSIAVYRIRKLRNTPDTSTFIS